MLGRNEWGSGSESDGTLPSSESTSSRKEVTTTTKESTSSSKVDSGRSFHLQETTTERDGTHSGRNFSLDSVLRTKTSVSGRKGGESRGTDTM